MTTFDLSPAQALYFIRQRRPQAHPNYGFRRQLEVFGQMNCLISFPAPLQTHPLYVAWQRRQKREAKRFLSRLEDVVSIPLDKIGGPDAEVAIIDDFPTDPTEASSLLCEIEATHFLSISPAILPKLSSPATKHPAPFLCPPLSVTSSTSTRSAEYSTPSSVISSPTSSRSSSFSMYSLGTSSRTSSSSLDPSAYVNNAGQLALKTSDRMNPMSFSRDSIDLSRVNERVSKCDSFIDPDFLQLSGVQYLHVEYPSGSDNASDRFVCLDKGSTFISQAVDAGSVTAKSKVLIHCTNESRAYLTFCAYLVGQHKGKALCPDEAIGLLENGMVSDLTLIYSGLTILEAFPLFSATASFRQQLGLYASRHETESAQSNSVERHSPSYEGPIPDFNLDELLARCAGVGHPGFSFDAEMFRGTLSTHRKTKGQM